MPELSSGTVSLRASINKGKRTPVRIAPIPSWLTYDCRNYCQFSAARQLAPVHLLSARRREASVVSAAAAPYLLASS